MNTIQVEVKDCRMEESTDNVNPQHSDYEKEAILKVPASPEKSAK